MSRDSFNLSTDGPIEIRQNANIVDIERDVSSPTGIMIKIKPWGSAWNEPFYWVPYHYHCDEDEIDTDGWLSANTGTGYPNSINVAWDTKQDIPLYCYSTRYSIYYHNECHSAMGVRFTDIDSMPILNIGIGNPFGPAFWKFFDCRNMGMEWHSGLGQGDLNYYPSVIRIDQQNIDEFAVCFWSYTFEDSRIAHFKIITDPSTQDPEYRGFYKVTDIEYIGIEDKDRIIIDLYHSGNTHKTLTMGAWANSALIFGTDTIGNNRTGSMVFNNARILGPDNVIFGHLDGQNVVWKSIKGSPIDGWQQIGTLNGRYYTYPIGINTLHRPINGSYSFWLFDRWALQEPLYWRYAANVSSGFWTSTNNIPRAFAPGPPPYDFGWQGIGSPWQALIINTDDGDLGFAPDERFFTWGFCLSKILDTNPISAKTVNKKFELSPYLLNQGYTFGVQNFDVVILPYSYFKGK